MMSYGMNSNFYRKYLRYNSYSYAIIYEEYCSQLKQYLQHNWKTVFYKKLFLIFKVYTTIVILTECTLRINLKLVLKNTLLLYRKCTMKWKILLIHMYSYERSHFVISFYKRISHQKVSYFHWSQHFTQWQWKALRLFHLSLTKKLIYFSSNQNQIQLQLYLGCPKLIWQVCDVAKYATNCR